MVHRQTPTAPSSSSDAPQHASQTTQQRANTAATALASIARQQMANDGQCTSYGALEPHIAAIMDWMQSLPADDISVRDQVPPIITPLRGILEHVLGGTASADAWANLVAVAGKTCATFRCGRRGTRGNRYTSCCTRRGIRELAICTAADRNHGGGNPHTWPTARLPTLQEATMRLLRGISRNIPAETLGQPDLGFCWWEADRHQRASTSKPLRWGEYEKRHRI